jgi:hypothetical protein
VPGASIAFAIVVLAVGFHMTRQHTQRVGPDPAELVAYKQIARAAEQASRPGDLVMTPPDQGGFRTFSHRAVIVEFGTFRYGKGDSEWVQRVTDLTQDPRILDPALGHNAYARGPLIAGAYDRVAATSELPICRYRPDFAVLRAAVPKPAWLEPVAANGIYALYRVKIRSVC